MDKTNRVVKICRRLDEIDYALSCKDLLPNEEDILIDERECLEHELDHLEVASG